MYKLLDCILIFSTLLSFSWTLPHWTSLSGGYSPHQKNVGPFWPTNQESEQFDDNLFSGNVKTADHIDSKALSKEKVNVHPSFEDVAAFDDDSESDQMDPDSKTDQIWSKKDAAETGSFEKCDKCPPGYGFVRICNATHGTLCEPCAFRSTYSDHVPHFKPCAPCSKCGPGMFEDYPCTPQADTFCDSCRERSRWPADDLWQNDDFIKKCSDEIFVESREFEKSRNNRNRVISGGLLKNNEDRRELSSEEMPSGLIKTVKITDLTKDDQDQLDRLYKSVGKELKELEDEENKMEAEAANSSPESHESEPHIFKLGEHIDHDNNVHDDDDESKKSSEEIFIPEHQNSDDNPKILSLEKSDGSYSTKEISAGIVEETIAVEEQYPAVDTIEKMTVAPPAVPMEATDKNFGAIFNVISNKIEKLQPNESQKKYEYKEINIEDAENQRNIAFKPSAHSYPYEELIHPDQFRLKQIKKAIWLYGLTAAMLVTVILLLTCYARSCLRYIRRNDAVKIPSNLTDQDDRIITECARIMAEKEAPKKRPSIFASKSLDGDESLTVLENPLIGYLEDCQEPMVHVSTESLIPKEKQRQKKNDNNIAVV